MIGRLTTIFLAIFAIGAIACFSLYNGRFFGDTQLIKEFVRVNNNVRSFEEIERLICVNVERSNLYAVTKDEDRLNEHEKDFETIGKLISSLQSSTKSIRRKRLLSQIKYGVENHHNYITKLEEVRAKLKQNPDDADLKKQEGEYIFSLIDRSSLGFLRLSVQLKEENSDRLKELEKSVVNLVP